MGNQEIVGADETPQTLIRYPGESDRAANGKGAPIIFRVAICRKSGGNPFFKKFSSFNELKISNIQAEGIAVIMKAGWMARRRSRRMAALPSSHVQDSRRPSRLIFGPHSGPAGARRLICYNIKVPLIFFIISHHRHVMTPTGASCPPGCVLSIAGVFCNFVKLGMSLRCAGET